MDAVVEFFKAYGHIFVGVIIGNACILAYELLKAKKKEE